MADGAIVSSVLLLHWTIASSATWSIDWSPLYHFDINVTNMDSEGQIFKLPGDSIFTSAAAYPSY